MQPEFDDEQCEPGGRLAGLLPGHHVNDAATKLMLQMPPRSVKAKRSPGRPRIVGGNAGRAMLVVAARKLLRRRPRLKLSRKELALEAGVTPAMVHYHFREQAALIEEAARPIVDGYLARLRLLLADDIGVEQKFRSIVVLLVEIARSDGFLLDAYIPHLKGRRGNKSDVLVQAYDDLARFFAECSDVNYIRVTNLAFTVTLLWGACKVVAQTPELLSGMPDDNRGSSEIDQTQADVIVDVFVRGIGSQTAGARPT